MFLIGKPKSDQNSDRKKVRNRNNRGFPQNSEQNSQPSCFVVSPALLVCKIFLSQVPAYIVNILHNFFINLKNSHLHVSQLLVFHCVICNTNGCPVIAMDGIFCFQVSKIHHCLPENHTDLATVEQCAQFGLCHHSNGKS
jgi:hypothetical protein